MTLILRHWNHALDAMTNHEFRQEWQTRPNPLGISRRKSEDLKRHHILARWARTEEVDQYVPMPRLQSIV